MPEHTTFEEVVDDVREFFRNTQHWIYRSPGSPSTISPDSVYHVTQLEVLFEDKHFHDRTYRALRQLAEEGFLGFREEAIGAIRTTVLWRSNIRYVERAIRSHLELVSQYSSPKVNKATGDYAELLTLMGLSRLHLALVGRNTNSYLGKVWTESGHDLDFIMEHDGIGYGVEVKNTFDYFPDDELEIKLKMCQHLGIRPLFIVRHRKSTQWYLTKDSNGLLYVFKSKIFPLSQEPLAEEIWQKMRLPVTVWSDWPGHFYRTIERFLHEENK